MRQALEDDGEFDVDPAADLSDELSTPNQSFPWVQSLDQQHQLRPLPSQVSFIWEIYVERVDPFVKVLHLPTTFKTIKEAKCKTQLPIENFSMSM